MTVIGPAAHPRTVGAFGADGVAPTMLLTGLPAVLVTVLLVTVLLTVTGCGSDGGADPATTVAAEPAPSRTIGSIVSPPTLPPPCDPATFDAVVAESDHRVDGRPDQVIDLVNIGDEECDVDISATGGATPDMEPSVRLAPGGVGHVWIEGRDDCDETLADPDPQLLLDINGAERAVDLTFVSPCGVELVAFFTD